MPGKITTDKAASGLPRQAWASVSYRRKATKQTIDESVLQKYIETFSYVDASSGESDSVSITLCNRDLIWIGKYLPKKGDTIYTNIYSKNWKKKGVQTKFECGTFCCDDRNYSFPEAGTATIGGVSVPETHAFRSTGRSKTWQGITMWEIANTLAKRYNMKLSYTAPVISVKKAEQSDEDDCSFLNKLCNDYGLAMKIYCGNICIYDIERFEKKPAVDTIKYAEILDGDYNSTLTGTYTGVKMGYTAGNSEKTLQIGGGERILHLSDKADSYAEAVRKARAKLAAENRKAETLKVTVAAAGRKFWATSVINITEAGFLNGRWFIDKATHNVSASDGYTVLLELHRVK